MGCFGARKAPRSPLGKHFYGSFGGCGCSENSETMIEVTQRIETHKRREYSSVVFSCHVYHAIQLYTYIYIYLLIHT